MINPFVYALFDLREPSHIRYVGMTMTNPRRPLRHAISARHKRTKMTYCVNWIRSLQAQGLEYGFSILQEYPKDSTVAEVHAAEQNYIKVLRAAGHKLTNATDGGPGVIGFVPSEDTRARMSAAKKGKHPTEANIAATTAGVLRHYADPTARAHHIASVSQKLTGIKRSEATKAKLRVAALGNKRGAGHTKSEEERLRTGARLKEAWVIRRARQDALKAALA